MKFKMKEATNKQEAIISLLDVQTNKPNLLPNNSTFDESILDGIPFLELRDLYIKVKTAYYSSLDFKNRF
jgi:hypothetical protein